MYALVNEGNIKMLTRELLEYLKAADADFRPDLTAKICLLVQRFAPSKQWQFDSLLEVGPCSLSHHRDCSALKHSLVQTLTISLNFKPCHAIQAAFVLAVSLS